MLLRLFHRVREQRVDLFVGLRWRRVGLECTRDLVPRGEARDPDVVAHRELDDAIDGRHPGVLVLVHRRDDLGMAQQTSLVRRDPIDLSRATVCREERDGRIAGARIADQRLECAGVIADELRVEIEHARIDLRVAERPVDQRVGQPHRGGSRRGREVLIGIDRQLVQHRDLIHRGQRHEAARRHHPPGR